MDILVGERASGKTTRLIQMSAEGKGIIVAPTPKMAKYIADKAKEMELTIPEPIGWSSFVYNHRREKGPFLLDEVGLILNGMGITTATLDTECSIIELSNEEGEMSSWAKQEIELAIASEKESAKGTDDWQYGASCYESAIRAYQSLLRDSHSGTSIQITKSILNRLIDGKCLTPIEDTDDVWNEIADRGGENKNVKEYQCSRMSSLFKKIDKDGKVTYTDINRVSCIDISNPSIAYHNGFATRLVEKIFPIEMPYLAPMRPYKVFTEQLLFGDKGDFDTVAYLYILLPDGQKIDLNRYFKEDENGQLIPMEKEEWDARKAAKIAKALKDGGKK